MTVILSDFDGTITKEDSLYNFFDKYADKKWLEVEKLWKENKISSKECLIKEFELVEKLSESLIDEFISQVEIDDYFVEFYDFCKKRNIDFYVVSDGVDYFIDKILQNNKIKGLNVISNHGEFIDGKFNLSFPNGYSKCRLDSGTCKCKIADDLKKNYNKICYIGDGTSDFCISKKADYLFAKAELRKHCDNNGIKYIPFGTFKEVLQKINPYLD